MPTEDTLPQSTPLEATVHAVSTDGRGIARLADGRVVFVPRVLPGERVLLSEPRKRMGVFEAVATERLSAHPQRRAPPCPVFGRCGGCQLQHADDSLQNELRVSFLHHNLRRLGGFDDAFLAHAKAVTHSHTATALGYRRRLRWHVQEKTGFMAAGSNNIVGTDTCLLGEGALASSAAVATQAAANATPVNAARAASTASAFTAAKAKVEVEVTLDAHGALHTRLLENRRGFEPRRQGTAELIPGMRAQKTNSTTQPHLALPHPRLAPFLVHPESFVQPHTDAARLYGETLEAALVSFLERMPQTPENPLRPKGSPLRMWDLYCGNGAFSFVPFFLAPEQRASHAFHVVAVEGVGHAVESCVLNHAQNQNRFEPGAEAGFRTVAGDVAAFVRSARASEAPQVVIADPPRDGMGTASLQQLVTLFDATPQEPRLFLYVACDSGSLARDMKPLLLGGFKLEALHVFHTFAQSAHFETIAVLTRGVAP